jgi:DNA (cytosine-5)-methyltransferase 1
LERTGEAITKCLTARGQEGHAGMQLIKVKQIGTKFDSNGGTQPYQQDRVYDADGIVPALNQGKADLIIKEPTIGAIRGRNPENPNDNTKGIEFKQRLELNKKGESNCLTSDVTMNMVIEPNYSSKALNETIENSNLTQGEPHHNSLRMFDGYRIRRLTPIECERLQGFPDDHTSFGNYDGEVKPMSNTQRYKQCGNAVTVDVVEAVAKKCIPLFKTNQK